jgi:hypothetical protein
VKCPRCDAGVLDERERQGVVVDVCPSCRGVWLDRGELEKLLAAAKRELEEERAYYQRENPAREPYPREGHPREAYPREPYPREGYRRDSEPPSSRPGYSKHGHYRKKGWLENLGDIFD